MDIEELLHYISEHGHTAWVNADGSIQVETVYTYRDADGNVKTGVEEHNLPARFSAVRDWLNY